MALLHVLVLCVLCVAVAWRPVRIPQSTFVGLFALPRQQADWRYLPLQNKPPSKFTLFAARLASSIALPYYAVSGEWEKFLPLSSSMRITKALLRRQQTQILSGDFFTAASVAEPAKYNNVNAVANNDIPVERPNAFTSRLVSWLVNLLISLKVITRRTQQLTTYTPISTIAPTANVRTRAYSQSQSTTISKDAAEEWAREKLQELDVVHSLYSRSSAIVVETELVAPVAVAAAAAAIATGKSSYWPASARHLALLQSKAHLLHMHTLTSQAAKTAQVKGEKVQKGHKVYWPTRYW